MSDSANLKEDSSVLKCRITVTKNASGYSVKYDPEIIPVTQNNTNIHFHIDAKSSDAVEIDSVTINPPGQTQLVDGQLNANRQQFKLKDLNTVKGTFNLKFEYRDKNGAKVSAMMLRECEDNGIEVPEIENNPPG